MKIIPILEDENVDCAILSVGKTWTTLDIMFQSRSIERTRYYTKILNPWHVTGYLEDLITEEQAEDIQSYLIKKLGISKKKIKNEQSERSGVISEVKVG